jgi:ADP-ribosylglycohydrolase
MLGVQTGSFGETTMDAFEHAQADTDTGPIAPRDRFLGCLLGGAVGDALGAPVEFKSRAAILEAFGPQGITEYAPAYGGLGRITDDTQMTLFTAEGLLRGWVRGCSRGVTTYVGVTAHAYQRWLATQGEPPHDGVDLVREPGWLYPHRDLHHRRGPGNTCLSALRAPPSEAVFAVNDSKGCGGVMRVAPVGLFHWSLRDRHSPRDAFTLGCELAALTHGHPTGQLTAGVLAVLIRELTGGASLPEALEVAKPILREERDHHETLRAIELAEDLAAGNVPSEKAIARLGEGWIAEEALAISLYCALVARDFRHGVILAVNHDGDSDSTGAITGNLLGTLHGLDAIPTQWLDPLELRDVISEIAGDLYDFTEWPLSPFGGVPEQQERLWRKYPGY